MSTDLVVRTEDLDRAAAQIEAGGTERDGRVAGLLKGISSGISSLLVAVGLVKGEDAEEGDDDNTEEDKAGFDDAMAKGNGAEVVEAVVVEPEQGHIEAGDLIKGLSDIDGRVTALGAQLTAMQDENALLKGTVAAQDEKLDRLLAEVASANARIAAMAQHAATTSDLLAKGIGEIYDVARHVVPHAAPITPDVRTGRSSRLGAEAAAFTKADLVKGQARGALSLFDVQYYQTHHAFSPDDAESNRIAAKLSAAISTT